MTRSRGAAERPGSRVTRFLFLATVFCVTFSKIQWEIAGTVSLADILALGFLVAFAIERSLHGERRMPKTSAVVFVFGIAFLVVYLLGWFNIDTAQGAEQLWKGLVKFGIHFLFVVAAVAYVARGGESFYWRTLGMFAAGIVFNAAYGVIQLAAAQAGANLDSLLSWITGGASSINVYGAVDGQDVYRPNALTGDPNHLGIMLAVPLLALLPLYLRLERGHRLRRPLAFVLPFLFVVLLATLSRSGLVGLAAGGLVLLLPYRRRLLSRDLLVPLTGALALVAIVVLQRADFFERVIRSRFQTGGGSTSVHFSVYEFIPDVLSVHPLLGLGFNNFSVYYEMVTGKSNWGPHSFYVALLVETGLIGTILFLLFLWYLFKRLGAARHIGRALAAVRDPIAARVRPVAWGLTAALTATIVSNVFYLTMTFYYFYVLAVLALALPVVFGRRLRTTA